MKDYRLEIRIKNNRLMRRINDAGFFNVTEFCRAHDLQYTRVSNFLNLSRPPIGRRGKWSPVAIRLSEIFGCLPGDLFPADHLTEALKPSVAIVEVDQADIVGLSGLLANNRTPEALMIEAEDDSKLGEVLDAALDSLTQRQADILRSHNGIGCEAKTLDELSAEHGVTRERIRQIEAKALRLLRDPHSELAQSAGAKSRTRGEDAYDMAVRHGREREAEHERHRREREAERERIRARPTLTRNDILDANRSA